MTHAVIRTSPHGQNFIGRCSKCGEDGLGMGAALVDCPADGVVSDRQALLEPPGGVSPGKDETDAQMLARIGTDARKWASEFRKTALSLGYSDMDEDWLIGWFANAIESGRP